MNQHQMNLGNMLADVTTQQHASGCTMCTFGNKIVRAFLDGANVTDTVTIHRKYPLSCHASLYRYSPGYIRPFTNPPLQAYILLHNVKAWSCVTPVK